MNDALWLGGLALGFAAYAVLHSVLASTRCKQWVGDQWPALVPAYRLLYNLIAVLLLLPILALVWLWPGDLVWQRPELLVWPANILAVAAVAAFIHSLNSYDLSLFSGSRQWQWRRGDSSHPVDDGPVSIDGGESFSIGFWHRFVRHPWYCFALLVLWTRDMNAAQLAFYLLVTAYFVIGSRLEERKLIAAYGDRYRRYCQRVPGLLPLPWRWLSRGEAEQLQQRTADQ
ncbi:methyltransferase family protein [Motiliproteus sediminis]|uniref:methyltransferase family protein n=1 Tax=Motiliproteus sediminis TaxID=1468178 RepID=UPI001AEF7F7E|nr:hypothetical protein [Motiliproteus sediminis]